MEALGSLSATVSAPLHSSAPTTPARARFAPDTTGGGVHLSAASHDTDVARLQKANFNLKLRIYYLEERLQQQTGAGGDPTAASLHEEIIEQRMLIEEKSQELEQRNLLLVKARNAIESLQTDVELAHAEIERLKLMEQEGGSSRVVELQAQLDAAPSADVMARKDEELKRLQAQVDVLQEGARRGENADELQREMVRLSAELGEARGRADALSKQAHEVAQLEADEIASLQKSMASLRQELEAERSMGMDLAKELELKTNLLSETDRALKAMEDRYARLEEQRARAEADMSTKLTDSEHKHRDRQLELQTVRATNLELSAKVADLTGQVQAMQGACRTLEGREQTLRDEMDALRSQLREESQSHSLSNAQADMRVEEERSRVRSLETELVETKRAARDREVELLQQLRHWEHHLRSVLVDFLSDDVAALAPSLARSLSPSAGTSPPAADDLGQSKEAQLELLTLLKSLPRIRRWFESAAAGFVAKAGADLEAAMQHFNRMSTHVDSLEDRVRPTLVAASAAISNGHVAEQRASMALVEKGSLQQEATSLRQAVDDKQATIDDLRVQLAAAVDRQERLQETNRTLIKELEEKRSVAEMAARDKAIVVDDAERLKRQVLERDAQLEQHMHKLAGQLSGVALPTTGAAVSEDAALLVRRLEQLVEQVASLVAEASGTTKWFLSRRMPAGDSEGDTHSVSSTLSTLLHRNEELSYSLQQLTLSMQHVADGRPTSVPLSTTWGAAPPRSHSTAPSTGAAFSSAQPPPPPTSAANGSRTAFFTSAAVRASHTDAAPLSVSASRPAGGVTPLSAPSYPASAAAPRPAWPGATLDMGQPFRMSSFGGTAAVPRTPVVTGPGVSSGVLSGGAAIDRFGAAAAAYSAHVHPPTQPRMGAAHSSGPPHTPGAPPQPPHGGRPGQPGFGVGVADYEPSPASARQQRLDQLHTDMVARMQRVAQLQADMVGPSA